MVWNLTKILGKVVKVVKYYVLLNYITHDNV